MIKNSKQYNVAKNRFNDLNNELNTINKEIEDRNSAAYLLAASGLRGLIDELVIDIEEYESLTNENKNSHRITVKNIEDLPNALIKARLAKNLSQSDLAKLLGLEQQQIQRYEATEYESASWTRIINIILALDINICMQDVIILKNKDLVRHLILNDYTDEIINEASQKIVNRLQLMAI
jgi:transcriptional regulator with XRE-family HTH domain